MEARDALWGYVFLLPWLIGLIVFWLGPILLSFLLSFTEYDVISDPRFIGLANYQKAFFDDPLFWSSIARTFVYSAVVVPISLAGALGLAILLDRGVRGTSVFRAIFYVPTLTPAVALVVLWVAPARGRPDTSRSRRLASPDQPGCRARLGAAVDHHHQPLGELAALRC
jgi:multiple sugar transport system permease protein